jgi:signal transduction histidine kinase
MRPDVIQGEDLRSGFAEAHAQLIVHRQVPFAVGWLGAAVLWHAVLVAESPLSPTSAVAGLLAHAGILAAALVFCRARPGAALPVTVATAVLLGLCSIAVFAAAGGGGDILAFVLLTLYLATALFFAWGWMAAIVVLVATVVPWLAATPLLAFHVSTLELGTGVVVGATLAIATAEGHARIVRAAFLHRQREEQVRQTLEASRDAYRELAEKAQAARADAEAVARAKDDFLATISHELRSPLHAVLTWSHMVRRGGLDEERTRQALETIERNARAQARLIEDLLDVSRIVSGKLALRLRPLDLRALLSNLLDAVRGSVEGRRIVLEARLPPEPFPVTGDPTRLQQVFDNLLSNAIKFSHDGGRITVELRKIGGRAEVTIQDTGIGIPPEALPRLFRRFEQGGRATTRRYGGLGLGLAIARQLVEAHRGTIHAASAGVQRGATFTVRLPLDPAAAIRATSAESARPPTDPQRLHGLGRLRVLVVEDDADARRFLVTLFSQCGAEVAAAASAAEALQYLEIMPPDVLVSDLAMPDATGFDLIRKVRSREKGGRRLPAVAVSALATIEDRERALGAGFDVHVAKPVDPDEVVAAVARAVGGA